METYVKLKRNTPDMTLLPEMDWRTSSPGTEAEAHAPVYAGIPYRSHQGHRSKRGQISVPSPFPNMWQLDSMLFSLASAHLKWRRFLAESETNFAAH